MAAAEIYDYISSGVTADSTWTLNLNARGVAREYGIYNQVVHLADDGSEEVVSLAVTPTFYIDVPWNAMNESDSGTVFDFWCSTAKGNGRAKRFHYVHAYGTQTHTYTARFDSDIARDIREGNIHGSSVKLKIIGKSTI